MPEVLQRVIEIAAWQSGVSIERLSACSALDQDVRVCGDDVTDFIEALALEFGDGVQSWPWPRFVCLDEGLSLLFPVVLVWQLLTWPFRGSFEYPHPFERLELGHIAAVIENGEWFEP